ncbi:MAG: hypothetical protein HYU87_10520 [Chloroflexi bacterium]|nr:hypothetical protein [Chloroflexota bacterium]
MGYEIWDRDDAALVGSFDDQEQALDYLRELVRPLKAEETTRALDPLQLVRVSDRGETTEILRAGVDLLTLIFAPALAR